MTSIAEIRTCIPGDAGTLTGIIRESFRDVAERFGLTGDNSPSHPSNCTADWITRDMARGVAYYMLVHEGHAAGCVALERPDPEVCYLERLGVLPDMRRQGFGRILVDHVISESGNLGAGRVDIGIIADHTELKDWYARLGFHETGSRDFVHLPFRVTFMTLQIR